MTQLTLWQFWIDRGGTFTDIVALSPKGEYHTHKLLSENPESYPDAALQGIRDLLGISNNTPIPAEKIQAVKMGTTVATNALLERKGTPTALLITQGFKDALRIAYQNRPRLFDLNIKLPELLYSEVAEVEERLGANGEIVKTLNEQQARNELSAIYANGIRSIAIVLMHGYRYPAHEKRLAEIASEIGFTQISTSHEVSPLMKLISRGDTTVVDAYLSPILRHYIDLVATELGDTQLMFMQSNGGLVSADSFQGKDSILSGPAGGIVGAVKTCQAAGHNTIIGFDMGGTSTDVSHFNGEYERSFNSVVAGVRMCAPMMKIHTVAAGGGSILHFDGNRFRVGPDSAGANPGPTCYRRGGPLTITDCNLMLGKLDPEYFPKVFGPNGDLPLDKKAVIQKFIDLANKIKQTTGRDMPPTEVAEGFLKIAIDNMANAIKEISTQRGFDISHYSLCSFGGAGGQHACRVADALGMKKVILHPMAGVLSAYGMGLADFRSLHQHSVEEPLEQSLINNLQPVIGKLIKQGQQEIIAQGISSAAISSITRALVKYHGTDSTLSVVLSNAAETQTHFEDAHRQRYGFIVPEKALIIESLSIEIIGKGHSEAPNLQQSEDSPQLTQAVAGQSPNPISTTELFTGAIGQTANIYQRDDMQAGSTILGPAIILETTGTNIIEAGWQATLSDLGNLELERIVPLPKRTAIGTDVDPIMLEVFNNLFMSIAEQMGTILENTSYSVNVKERLDFSCAIFDPQGELVANAPHMPVHLGSMGASVKAVIKQHAAQIHPEDVFITNAPYNGGTHLPDVTVITPVFQKQEYEKQRDDKDGLNILFYVASRGHHADIGGISPGSMPPNSTSVEEEGILFDNIRLVDQTGFRETAIREMLGGGPYPARNPDQNIADLKAQIAANEKGVQEMWRMIDQFGQDVVIAYMEHVQDNAEEAVRRVIDTLEDGRFTYNIDGIATIKVSINVDKTMRSATVDFTGTSDQLPSNFNAPSAVCYAAVLYVFRTLVEDDIPMNQGCLKPLNIIIPEGSMLNPQYPAAVVAGNVETSQWITNALYGALGVVGAAQGTMNNFTFGDEQYQYYETISGGTGAGPGFDGTSAVQSHMTNSRLTDPEVLEWRFPVRVDGFCIRENSGGAGMYQGGNGVIRRIEFLQNMNAAILSSHRETAPFGTAGGQQALVGKNYVERHNGQIEKLKATDQTQMAAGDIIVIETPGGGGYGEC